MRKIIKKWGSSLVITINPEEQKIAGINEGDVVDISIDNIESVKNDIQ